jgi:TPR repeat protein
MLKTIQYLVLSMFTAVCVMAAVPALAQTHQETHGQAEDGNPDAQSSLADAYLHGRDGFEQNDHLALDWYKKIAERSDDFAIQQVGRLLLTGDFDVAPEAAKDRAIKWYQDALAKGHSTSKRQIERITAMSAEDVAALRLESQLEKALAILECNKGDTLPCGDEPQKSALLKIKTLADQELTSAQSVWGSLLFDEGAMAKLGGKPDPNAAIAYLTKAANKGDENAMLFLARVYEHGRGVTKDTTAALMWYDRAMAKMTAERAEAAKNNVVISGGNDTLIQCKFHFLRGDKIAEHTRQECTAWDREAFYRAY